MEVKIEECSEEKLGAVRVGLDKVFGSEGFGAIYSRQKLSKFDKHIHDLNRVRVVLGVFEMLQRLELHLPLIIPGDS